MNKNKIKKIYKIYAVLIILLVIVTGMAVYFYTKSKSANPMNPNGNSTVAAQKEVDELLARMGKLIVLPEGESPTVATVSDPEKLKGQQFFAKAKVGDKVVLYTTAKKAYLYDPVADKIIEVTSLNLDATAVAR